MGEAAVREILDKIQLVSEADSLLLEQRLAERAEAQWFEEAARVRDEARQRGIEQEAIDRAIEAVRYSGGIPL